MKTTLCNEWQNYVMNALLTNFFIFPITLPLLNVAWCYKMVSMQFQAILFWGEGGTCK